MKRYRVTATLESPLVVRRERQSQRSEGVEFIAGTLVRGALAQAYLHQHGQADGPFRLLFLDEENGGRFGPLDPAAAVYPLTAVSCKREGVKHCLADLLWLRVARRLAGKELPENVEYSYRRCGNCKQDLKAQAGFPAPPGARKKWLPEPAIHVGIDRHTHTAAEKMFFSLPAMQPHGDRSLGGVIELSADAESVLRQLLADEDHLIRIGHARTRGYGRVRLELGEEAAEEPADWDGWSRGYAAFLKEVPAPLPGLDAEHDFLFSLSLPTGAVLLDDVLRYTLDPAGMVPWLPPLPVPREDQPLLDVAGRAGFGGALWCLGGITRHERLRGWNAAHGLPRQDEWAVSRGAVYAYLYRGPGRDELKAALAALQRDGLGARRGEGLGRVVVSDAFHQTYCRQENQP